MTTPADPHLSDRARAAGYAWTVNAHVVRDCPNCKRAVRTYGLACAEGIGAHCEHCGRRLEVQ